MYGLIVITFFFYITLIMGAPTDPFASDMKQREKMGLECLKQVNIDRKIIENAVRTLNFPDNETYKEFLACSYKKQGFQNEDGKILYENIKEFLMRYYNTKSLQFLDLCKRVTGENDGEKAFNALKCIMDNLKKIEDQNENDI